MKSIISFALLLTFISCNTESKTEGKSAPVTTKDVFESLQPALPKHEDTSEYRFNTPDGFSRVKAHESSFAHYLQNLPLKPENTPVKLYNGQLKSNQQAHVAVVDLPIGYKNLHQCADAIIRLRADYFHQKQAFDSIQFHFTNGFLADYKRWQAGARIRVTGNDVDWVEGNQNTSGSEKIYWEYLEMVFMYAGTLSLEKEMKPEKWDNLSIGDVFIRGGSPGHAIIVVDMARNEAGEKVFMLAQSYMPAQEIHILKNPNDRELSPWYQANFDGDLDTPEWTFSKSDLKRF